MDQFGQYFSYLWLSQTHIKDIWEQFGNSGPRTTNWVEGWHNGLPSRRSTRHPDLAEFIQFLQTAQYATQNRLSALLLEPLAVSRSSSSRVAAKNNRLAGETDRFADYVSTQDPTYQDVCNYLDNRGSIGVQPEAT
ncbi:hypothetical protein MRX96_046159 [Rhipicephalus microplus]